MSNPNPRRFRFSLGFLLAWVLLTGLLSGIFFDKISGEELTEVAGSTSVDIYEMPFPTYQELHGWPFANYRTEFVKGVYISLPSPMTNSENSRRATPETRTYSIPGMLGNIFAHAALALLLIWAVRRSRIPFSSMFSAVKNE